jgi:hypothetical protein
MGDLEIAEDLRRLQDRRIFFGHQSVGADIVQGLLDLQKETGVEGFQVMPLDSAISREGGFLAEAAIGENAHPSSKCEAFREVLERDNLDSVEFALMKFCYVDITAGSDIDAVFENYRQTMGSLKERYPGVTFVHVTVPLTTIASWWERAAKRVLGRHENSIDDNVARNRYNAFLRSLYRDEPLFDLAAVESTRPDGSRERFSTGGKEFEALVEEYTYDGGHLNGEGRRRAAAALVKTLSAHVRQVQLSQAGQSRNG